MSRQIKQHAGQAPRIGICQKTLVEIGLLV